MPRISSLRVVFSSCTIFLSLLFILPTTKACQVWNADGVEVTHDYVVEKDALADCQGNSQCKEFRIENCDQVICWGIEACTRAEITNVTTILSCEGEHACHDTHLVAKVLDDDSNDRELAARVECIGDGACDVAKIEAVDNVQCLGFKACRKAHIKSNTIKCTGGEHKYSACDLVYFHTNCLYCGVNGCGRNSCHVKVMPGDVMAFDAEEDDPMTFKKCALEDLTGDCPAEYRSELDYEKEIEYGTEENENGSRYRRLLR